MNRSCNFVFTIAPTLPCPKRQCIALGLIAFGLITLLALGSPAAHAQTYTTQTLYSFSTKNGDGYASYSTLINVGGMLYGTTSMGGTYGYGTVFALNPVTHQETILHSFNGGDGIGPQAGLVYVNGILYGTTNQGGNLYYGTLFSINPDGTGFQTLYYFSGSANDGGYPAATLLNVNGILYGTTENGGSDTEGTVFSYNPVTKLESTIHQFTGSNGDGIEPFDSLVDVNVNGVDTLYGTTVYGGYNGLSSDKGTIFSMNTDGTGYQTLYSFTDAGGDGGYPIGGLTALNGLLYGTTQGGGTSNFGTVFSFDPATRLETPLYRFTGGGDGSQPFDSLSVMNGLLYGTTISGGIADNGTVFCYNPSTKLESTLHQFAGYPTDGGGSRAGLINVAGTLYGTTGAGGFALTGNGGTIFSLTSLPLSIPIAGSDRYTPKYSTPYAVHAPGVLANDSSGGSTLTATLVSNVTHGTLTFNSDGSFAYTPTSGFVGTDSFTYQAVNALGSSNIATVSLVIQTTAPIAYNDGYGPRYNTTYSVRNPGVLANDYNGINQSMTATLVSSVSHGTLAFHADGSFIYKPNLGYSGTDTFTYTATNSVGTSNTATVSLNVAAIAPIAYNDRYAPKYQTAYAVRAPGVLGNDDMGGSSPLTASLASTPTHGTLTFSSNGSFTYTPDAGFTGTDTFTYQAINPIGTSNTATVTLIVE